MALAIILIPPQLPLVESHMEETAHITHHGLLVRNQKFNKQLVEPNMEAEEEAGFRDFMGLILAPQIINMLPEHPEQRGLFI